MFMFVCVRERERERERAIKAIEYEESTSAFPINWSTGPPVMLSLLCVVVVVLTDSIIQHYYCRKWGKAARISKGNGIK